MKKALVEKIPIILPKEVENLTRGAKIYDSSCSPEARVYYVKKEDGAYYFKTNRAGTLEKEAEMDGYFHSLALGPKVIYYGTQGDRDLLVTREVLGEDCTAEKYLREPKRLARLLGTSLRALHSLDTKGCKRQDRLSEYLSIAEKNYESGNYDKSHFPNSFGYRSADEAYKVMCEGRHFLTADTLIHGDFCLPNVLLNGWELSGYIDLDGAGVADRHIDLFWGAWTLQFNLGTNEYRDLFFDAYGRDMIDKNKLKTIAAIEVFG